MFAYFKLLYEADFALYKSKRVIPRMYRYNRNGKTVTADRDSDSGWDDNGSK